MSPAGPQPGQCVDWGSLSACGAAGHGTLTHFNTLWHKKGNSLPIFRCYPMVQKPIFLLLLSLGLASQGRAADPPSPPSSATVQPGPSSAAVAAATPASSTVSSAEVRKSDAPATSDVTPEQMKTLRSAGYKPEVHNGQTFFCRREAVLGSRLESKVCGTAAEIERSTQNSQELAERIQTKAYTKANGNP